MEALNSLQSLSSVAIWPVLMMNWRSIVAYFPAVERFINNLNIDVLMQMVLGTWLGLSGLGFFACLALGHSAYSIYKTLRNLALVNFYTKCSITKNSTMYHHVVDWVNRNPKFQAVHTYKITVRHLDIEIPDDKEEIDITLMQNEIVSLLVTKTNNKIPVNGAANHQIYRRLDCCLTLTGSAFGIKAHIFGLLSAKIKD